MTKKTINNPIVNELKGSAWFKHPGGNDQAKDGEAENASLETQADENQLATPRYHDTAVPRNHDTTTPRYHDTVAPRHRDTTASEVDLITEAVSQVSTEAGTRRLTLEEKQELARIVFDYKSRKIHTTGNEISRIAINYLLADYRKDKEKSLLHQVLVALHKQSAYNK